MSLFGKKGNPVGVSHSPAISNDIIPTKTLSFWEGESASVTRAYFKDPMWGSLDDATVEQLWTYKVSRIQSFKMYVVWAELPPKLLWQEMQACFPGLALSSESGEVRVRRNNLYIYQCLVGAWARKRISACYFVTPSDDIGELLAQGLLGSFGDQPEDNTGRFSIGRVEPIWDETGNTVIGHNLPKPVADVWPAMEMAPFPVGDSWPDTWEEGSASVDATVTDQERKRLSFIQQLRERLENTLGPIEDGWGFFITPEMPWATWIRSGTVMFHSPDSSHLSIVTPLVSGLTVTPEILEWVSQRSHSQFAGHYWLRPGADEKQWQLVCGMKFPWDWMDQWLSDVVLEVGPDFGKVLTEGVAPEFIKEFGGRPWWDSTTENIGSYVLSLMD